MADRLLDKFETRGRGRPRTKGLLQGEDAATSRRCQYDQVTVHLPPDLVKLLDAAVKEDFTLQSRSDLIRRFCADGLRRRTKRRESAGEEKM